MAAKTVTVRSGEYCSLTVMAGMWGFVDLASAKRIAVAGAVRTLKLPGARVRYNVEDIRRVIELAACGAGETGPAAGGKPRPVRRAGEAT